jgi:hypothetical protein
MGYGKPTISKTRFSPPFSIADGNQINQMVHFEAM